ncbi:kelch domain-containing protein 3-like [Coffea eugenioides]|uniref:Kelch domain-containing protein 3-like isoform X1 n=2 Tax=Coffea arabica TaxID=13443 RepID=A0A6P6VD29_COFAR|nr:kelch domain-containing protein 3-like isoform X1 [Coffea arabica]XP_027100564.1 kelch domain-containing protein 3-like isoform X1 [Coffea arabica]XP_027100565.1 kelch domain-containing protein 3-like isoform X1 [Coffea arabica]XP_027100566.1 kelch domain-containing protein 3-like isoform X1 [Coffea arabica]XP_027169898.1 kelch domain-containing protein 3-like [Coffea eugenioides]XP_027169899.1 kelch domain-containing protein 3-like [Coffea eugenioides]XP_027169900.1 kelch domain-containin
MRWEKLQVEEGVGPGKRWGHTCNAIKGGKLLYVFGGYGKDNCQTNKVHVFDTVSRTWNEPAMNGVLPAPRDSHSCTTVGDNLFVFGGTDGRSPLGDLQILDTSSNTWISPSVRGDGPAPREGHSAALIGKRLFIFGGCGKYDGLEKYYDDVYILNTETFFWKRVEPSGTPPSKRDSHTCSSWKNKIIVIGGEDVSDYYLSDVHILDADSLVWCKLNTTGQLLPPRAGHTTVALGKYLFVFGGFSDEQNLYDDVYVLDMENGAWTKVMATGEGPSARFSMAGEVLDPYMGGVLVFMGGCNKNLEALADMYYLYTGLTREYGREERRLEKLSMRKQLKLRCQEQNPLVTAEGIAATHQPMHVTSYVQPNLQNIHQNQYQTAGGKKTFEARVTKSFADGYTIETFIDGKPLHGLLFRNKPINSMEVDDSTRKVAAVETDGATVNGDQTTSNITRPVEHKVKDVIQAHGVVQENACPPEAQLEAVATEMKIQEPAEALLFLEVGAVKPSAALDVKIKTNGLNNLPHPSSELPEDCVSTAKECVT